MKRKTSVLFITLDALRPEHLGCYGYKRNTSPNINRIAQEGIVFKQAIAQDTWTLPSMASILASAYSFSHNVAYFGDTIHNSFSTLPKVLKNNGYRTGFVGPYMLSMIKGFSRNFDLFDTGKKDIFKKILHIFSKYTPAAKNIARLFSYCFPSGLDHFSKIPTSSSGQEANIVTETAIKWLKDVMGEPFFLWLHYFDTHGPYKTVSPCDNLFLHDDFSIKGQKQVNISKDSAVHSGEIPKYIAEENINDIDYYIAKYDGKIRFIDEQIGILLSTLKELKLDDDTLIIISSDHGEYLGEHNFYFYHVGIPFEQVIKVPLIIRYDKMFKDRVIDGPVQSIDIAPTILDILGIPKPSSFQGDSLLPIIFDNKDYPARYIFSGDRKATAVRTQEYKLININYSEIEKYERIILSKTPSIVRFQLGSLFGSENPQTDLFFNLKKDPGETNYLTDIGKKESQVLKEALLNVIDRSPYKKPKKCKLIIDQETKDRLRGLGYLE